MKAADGAFQVQLPDNLAARVLQSKAKKVDLGIRPVHMELLPPGTTKGQLGVDGQVLTYEDLGEEGQLAGRRGQCPGIGGHGTSAADGKQ